MNYKKILEKAKAQGIDTCEVTYKSSKEINFSIFHHEVDEYNISSQSSVSARGIYNGKLGFASEEEISSKTAQKLIDGIKETASLIEKEEKPIIFKGSKKYHKKNVFNPELEKTDVKVKLDKLFELEKESYNASEYVSEVQVGFAESTDERVLLNSYGLNLKTKANYFYYMAQIIAKKGDEIKSDYEVFLGDDFSKFDPKALAKKAVEKTVNKFDGVSLKSKNYKCVLNPSTCADLLNAMVGAGFDAENIQKKSSVLVDKLNTKVFSSKVTIEEKPLLANPFFRYFDDEGVATSNKRLVDKGVIKTYLYNLETAAKDHVESTGNGYGAAKIYTDTRNLTLKPGRYTEDELISKVKEGVYITSVTGLHSGLNAQSGDFSLEAEGYLIKDGKIASPLKLLTAGGNIYKLFNDVLLVANNSKTMVSGVITPSILIKGLKISSL